MFDSTCLVDPDACVWRSVSRLAAPHRLQIKLERLGGAQPPAVARLTFVDLAGCERAGRTGNAGARLRCAHGGGGGDCVCGGVRVVCDKSAVRPPARPPAGTNRRRRVRGGRGHRESVAINSSLMTLARCLQVLRHNQQHATEPAKVLPYRESKVRTVQVPAWAESLGVVVGAGSGWPSDPWTGCPGSHLTRPLFPCVWHAWLRPGLSRRVARRRKPALSNALPLPPTAPVAFGTQLTHVFKDVLHGQGKIVLLVAVSPATDEFNETKRVLQARRPRGERQRGCGGGGGIRARAGQPPLGAFRCWHARAP